MSTAALFREVGMTAIAPVSSGGKGTMNINTLMQVVKAIRPGDSDPELEDLLNRTLAGSVTPQSLLEFVSKRLMAQKDGDVIEVNRIVTVLCPHCDRYSNHGY